jgi:hypothetical protein
MCHHGRLFRTGKTTFIVVTFAWSASAEPIRIPLNAFSGTERVVEFNMSPDEAPLPYSEDGATFTYTRDGFVFSFTQSLNLQHNSDIGGTSILTVALSEPVTIAGFDFRGSPAGSPTIEAEVFCDLAGLQSLGRIDFGTFGPEATAFIGFAADAGFTRADISFTTTGGGSWFIDDFRFDNAPPVPEPGTVSLTVLGIGLLCSRIRRMRRG